MIVRCGACQERMTVGPELMGERVCCPTCGVTVRVPGAVAPVAVQPVVPPPVRPVAVQPVVPRVAVPPGRGALVHRCPRCGADVEHGNTLCPHCGVNIKRARKKARRH